MCSFRLALPVSKPIDKRLVIVRVLTVKFNFAIKLVAFTHAFLSLFCLHVSTTVVCVCSTVLLEFTNYPHLCTKYRPAIGPHLG